MYWSQRIVMVLYRLRLENSIKTYKKYSPMFKDLLSIAIVEYLPDKMFIYFYSSIFVKYFRLSKYHEPKFVKEKYLIPDSNSEYENNLNQLEIQISKYSESTYPEDLKAKTDDKSTGEQKKALIIIPNGWLNSDTDEGRTQGPQIEFLIKGLTDSDFEVSTFEVIKVNSNFTPLENKIGEYEVIFIWSLTIISPEEDFFNYLRCHSKSKTFRAKLIGVITASPSSSRLLKYKKWKAILDTVVYYEADSEFKDQLEKLFNTIHTPYIQLHSTDTKTLTNFTPSVHVSCLIKYNRVAWLLTLRYQSLVNEVECHIRTMSIPLAEKNIRELYLPIEFIASQRSKYGFGFIMIHRNYNEDAHLIGSFWDYYRLGVIPIIQMQNIKPIAPYMTPYLDYFPVKSDQDLYNILSLSKRSPEYFEKLRQRILTRMRTEFSPEIVVKKLLTDSRIQI